MKITATALMTLSLGLSSALLASTSARAAVICNEDGDCWHAHEAYQYPAGVGVVVHPDDWRWDGDRYHWHEHEGRGYWHGGGWVGF